MNAIKPKLTQREHKFLTSLHEGMDDPGIGWLDEIASRAGIHNEREAAGVLSSLIKKRLARSEIDKQDGAPDAYWIQITESGKAAVEP